MTNLILYSNSFGWQLFPIYFHLKLHNANNANFGSFEKSTDSLKDRSFQRKKTITHRRHVIYCTYDVIYIATPCGGWSLLIVNISHFKGAASATINSVVFITTYCCLATLGSLTSLPSQKIILTLIWLWRCNVTLQQVTDSQLANINRPIANLARLGHSRSKVSWRSIAITWAILIAYCIKVMSLNISRTICSCSPVVNLLFSINTQMWPLSMFVFWKVKIALISMATSQLPPIDLWPQQISRDWQLVYSVRFYLRFYILLIFLYFASFCCWH